MKLSKFSIPFRKGEEGYIYNTTNGSILRYTKTGDHSLSLDKLSDKEAAFLLDQHVCVQSDEDDDHFVREKYTERLSSFDDVLYLTIEITTLCNFRCSFCYQASWDSRAKIKLSDIDKLVKILNESDLSTYKRVSLNIIGGEPFLFPEIVHDCYSKLALFCDAKNLEFFCKLNSNGYNLTPEHLRSFHNMEFMFPFLTKEDYGSIVSLRSGEENLRQKLISNVYSWVSVFNEDLSKRIIFRLNANERNVKKFKSYVREVVSFGFKNFGIALINTGDCDFNNYRNLMSEDNFMKWYFLEAIPILQSYNVSLPIFPRNSLSRCMARRKGSFKLFADGRIGLCNGVEYDEGLPHINDISNLDAINNLFKEIKEFHYLLHDDKCKNCDKAFLCGGASPCKGKICRGNIENVINYAVRIIK